MITQPPTTAEFDPALHMARQSLYRFAALSLLDPKAGSWDQLDLLRVNPMMTEAADLIRDLPAARSIEFGRGERPLTDLDPRRVLERLPDSTRDLNDEYEKTFGLLVSNACPPYESEYINSKFTFQRSNTIADVSGFYRAFGVTTSEEHPERPDHIVQELEFMAFLLGLGHQAAEGKPSDRTERLNICRLAKERFFREHLAWWVPTFARLLVLENGAAFYGTVGVFLAALIPAERSILKVAAPKDPVQPSAVERPEQCAGCLLSVEESL